MTLHDLELVKLRKVYPGGTVAVEAFDLRVRKGEFISFVGPSGCGKTTTLRMIAGLEAITAGDLLIRGQNYTRVPAERRPTSTIFQNYAIFPHMTVRENIAFGLEVRRQPAAEIRRKVDAIIGKLHLDDVADRREGALSGGQKQRLALARGLVVEPEILLLDEPLGALDANLRKSIQEELKILQRDLNITFVFVTHAQAEALSMGDRVVVMNQGRVEQISAPFELYTRPRSPFVARFIGRNILIPGRLLESTPGRVTLGTDHGPLHGAAGFETAPAAGGAAILAVPSEYVAVLPAGAPVADGADRVPARLVSLDVVGQIAFVGVVLGDGRSLRLETHVETVAGRGLATGEPVDLTWSPEQATVVLGSL
jgi:putative spermidine/putrescine transport system ATP-binding protein/spermidine/putrescine transport system ATP-binding protein